jgi:thymidine kinase
MIKVFTGAMFSGKSTALVDTYMNIWNKKSCKCYTPIKDTRSGSVLKSRNINEGIPAKGICDLSEIVEDFSPETRTIFIDEAQFLTGDVKWLVRLSTEHDIDIYIAGLNMTSEQDPFGIMPQILAIADEVQICKAVCFDCNKPASYSFCLEDKEDEVLVGNDEYVPLCGKCLVKRRENKLI